MINLFAVGQKFGVVADDSSLAVAYAGRGEWTLTAIAPSGAQTEITAKAVRAVAGDGQVLLERGASDVPAPADQAAPGAPAGVPLSQDLLRQSFEARQNLDRAAGAGQPPAAPAGKSRPDLAAAVLAARQRFSQVRIPGADLRNFVLGELEDSNFTATAAELAAADGELFGDMKSALLPTPAKAAKPDPNGRARLVATIREARESFKNGTRQDVSEKDAVLSALDERHIKHDPKTLAALCPDLFPAK